MKRRPTGPGRKEEGQRRLGKSGDSENEWRHEQSKRDGEQDCSGPCGMTRARVWARACHSRKRPQVVGGTEEARPERRQSR